MMMIVLAMVLTAEPASELHFFPSSFTVKGDYYRGGRRSERYAFGEDGVYRTPRD